VIRAPRRLSDEEIEALLALDIPARLATIDPHGFPHVTPLWFVWDDAAFHLTSYSWHAARGQNRVVIRLRPDRLLAVGSVRRARNASQEPFTGQVQP
jgi:nitroimidazol reductase NimA-like FMN-containing flavoprotein (pyridoxamine 5'-phosphate oxidase superfamily)